MTKEWEKDMKEFDKVRAQRKLDKLWKEGYDAGWIDAILDLRAVFVRMLDQAIGKEKLKQK